MAYNFQKFMATAEKHAVAGSSKLKATIAGHIYNIQIEEDLDNGSIVAKGDYIKPETYKAKESTGFAGVVLDKAANGNWYVEVNSQEEADLISNWLQAQGEKVDREYTFSDCWKYINCSLRNYDDICYWSCNYKIFPDTYQKQLSDVLLNYSKVNRNVYYEVENQEQYLEILDWLESKGEFVNSVSRELKVEYDWKYVIFNLSILESWALDNRKPNLPKAEFQFKSKPGLREQINPEYIFPIEDLSIYKYPITPEKCYKPIPEIGTEIKFISSKEEPQIEIPKLKVITNKIDLLTLKN